MIKMPTVDELRERFADLSAAREKIVSKSTPLRVKRDKHVADVSTKEAKMNEEIRDTEEGLYEIDVEMGLIQRALSGKTSAPEADAS